jgi:hypothetical protein
MSTTTRKESADKKSKKSEAIATAEETANQANNKEVQAISIKEEPNEEATTQDHNKNCSLNKDID